MVVDDPPWGSVGDRGFRIQALLLVGVVDAFVLLNCRRCRAQLSICDDCYRGQEFCRPCALQARRESCREYEHRYRASLPGKLGNARRQAEHRARKRAERLAAAEVVTHHELSFEPAKGQVTAPIAAAPVGGSAAAPASSLPGTVESAWDSGPVAQPETTTDAIKADAPEPIWTGRCAFCGCALAAFARRPGRRARRGARPRLGWR